MWTWKSAYPHKPVEGHCGPLGSETCGSVQLPVAPVSFGVGVALVVGSEIASMTVQLLPAGSPRDVEPPQVQSPEQPGTSMSPLLHAKPLLLNSVKPLQQARWPRPPQGAG